MTNKYQMKSSLEFACHHIRVNLGRHIGALALCLWAVGASAVENAPPFDGMAFQSYLVDQANDAVTGNKQVKFGIYSSPEGNNLLWGETQQVFFNAGHFSVILGEGTWDPQVKDAATGSTVQRSLGDVFEGGGARYIQISLQGQGGVTTALEPRLRLLPSAYSFRALSADKLSFNDNPILEVDSTKATIKGDATIEGGATIEGDVIVGSTSQTKNITAHGTIETKEKFIGHGTTPIGGIIMWSNLNGTVEPPGWAICNGQTKNGVTTPDLTGRFIVGAGAADSSIPVADTVNKNYAIGDNAGGVNEVTLTTKQMPAHNHDITDPGHTHSVGDREKSANQGKVSTYNASWAHNWVDDFDAWNAATRTAANNTTSITINNRGGGLAHENRPPFYALAYIMRVE